MAALDYVYQDPQETYTLEQYIACQSDEVINYKNLSFVDKIRYPKLLRDFYYSTYNVVSDYNEEISIRDLSREELKNEIINFSKFHDFVDALEISSALNLDVFEVNDVLTELIREGLFEEV